MKAGKMLASMALVFVLLSASVFAAGSISITSVSIPSSVTQGDTFTITVSVSGSQATSVSGTLTLPSGLSCTPTSSQTISLSGGGTGSASWSCTANVAGDYSNQITASVSATDSGTGGSLSASSQTGLSVLTPASLTASSTFSPSSVANGSSSTFTVGVNNLGDSSTTFNVSFACPSGLTCSSTSVGNTAIAGKSLVNSQFTITAPAAASGSYSITATVQSPVQANITTSGTLTVTVSTSSSSSSQSSSSSSNATGTPTTTTGTGNVTVTIPSVAVGSNVFSWGTVTGLYVTAIGINANTALSNAQLVVNTLSGAPSGAPTISGNVFNYFLVTPTNMADSNVYNVTLSFFVPKSWTSTNSVNTSTITLYRYNGGAWNALTTTETSNDSSNYYFNAYSPGFSNYAIAGQPLPSAVVNATTTPQSGNQSNATSPGISGTVGSMIVIILAAVAAAIVLAVIYLMRNKKLKALGLKPTGKWEEVKKKWNQ